MKILVMGVSGCGKSAVGKALADQLNMPFLDGDDFHPSKNIEKMSQGIPLTDGDRLSWLQTLNQQFQNHDQVVIACSALKQSYRNILRQENFDLITLYLDGSEAVIWSRLQHRENHYFKGKSLLQSQLSTLEVPDKDEAINIPIDQPLNNVINQCLTSINNINQKATMTQQRSDIALIGMGVMGKSLALNLLDHGFRVTGYDTDQKRMEIAQEAANRLENAHFITSSDLKVVLDSLVTPRVIALSVPAGNTVDVVIDALLENGLSPEDIVIDTGNSLWTDSIFRTEQYSGRLHFFSTAVSGGEEGARFGPSLMASGNAAVWHHVEPMWHAISAKIDTNGKAQDSLASGEPCAAYIGPAGSGHYVKMVHNGIEYADMQLICEAYQILKDIAGLSSMEIGKIFEQWNQGVLNSYLMEISADILQQQDPVTGAPLVDVILDKAGSKGTGLWTALNSLEVASAAPTIIQAVVSRAISSQRGLRQSLSESYAVEPKTADFENKTDLINHLHDALFCSKICAYAQGFALMSETATQQSWTLNFSEIARIWRGGCIIRAAFLQTISDTFEQTPNLIHLLLAPSFQDEIKSRLSNWRLLCAEVCIQGVAAPAILSSLSYFDAITANQSPANLLQAQRDFFGAHTYRRTDQPEDQSFHIKWADHPRQQVKA